MTSSLKREAYGCKVPSKKHTAKIPSKVIHSVVDKFLYSLWGWGLVLVCSLDGKWVFVFM
jgi:hypothetical protein